jgi:hypothetical protein
MLNIKINKLLSFTTLSLFHKKNALNLSNVARTFCSVFKEKAKNKNKYINYCNVNFMPIRDFFVLQKSY